MTDNTPHSHRSSLALKLSLAAVFLALLAGVSFWLFHTFISQPDKTILLTDLPAVTNPGARAPTPAGPTIGGLVQDQKGQPIANVRVRFLWPSQAGRAYQNGQTTTDARGHWTFSGVPTPALGRLSMTLTQRNYATLNQAAPPAKQLTDQIAVFTMSRGIDMNGQVVDGDGHPIEAQITSHLRNGGAGPGAKSDSSGKFTLRHLPDANMTLIAVKNGYAPAAGTARLVLTAGRTLSGRVTDKSAKPVGGATVLINQWQGFYNPTRIQVATDSQGNFKLPHAPMDQVMLEAYKQGYNGSTQMLSAGQNQSDFVLSAELTIRGAVIDAATHQPVRQFTVITGARWSADQPPNFGQYTAKTFTDGQYRQALSGFGGAVDAWFVRIEAKGYRPAVSPPLLESAVQDFELKPGKDLTGRVLAADGKPVAGAEIALALPGQQAYVNNGELQNQNQTQITTDSQGRFDLPPQAGRFIVVAVSPAGYAQADDAAIAKSSDLHLAAWGAIDGKLRIGTKPGMNDQINGSLPGQRYDPQAPMVYFGLNATTDNQGRFHFDRVCAGEMIVSRLVPMPGQANAFNNEMQEQVTVASGQTAVVTLGGVGRPVVGQLVIPKELADRLDWRIDASVNNSFSFPLPSMPANVQVLPPAAQAICGDLYFLTPAGRRYLQTRRMRQMTNRFYTAEVDLDGKFRVEDVPAGDYQITAYMWPSQGGAPLARGEGKFTMPPIPGGVSDEPLKIPDIALIATK